MGISLEGENKGCGCVFKQQGTELDSGAVQTAKPTSPFSAKGRKCKWDPPPRALLPVCLTGQNCDRRNNEEPFGAMSWFFVVLYFY